MRHALVVVTLVVLPLAAQTNRIDTISPMAPELAAYGSHAVGVRTVTVTDRNRPDVLNTVEGGPIARYDRALTLEVWYPAALEPGQAPGGAYRGVITRDPAVIVTLHGRAVRDAAPARGPFPLIVISHGYPGNRYLMSHLGENLASKGYVAASIDHRDSTYDDQKAFSSTLYNRPYDQLFVVNELARLGAAGSAHILDGLVDGSRVGLVGYSMGGYGVINVIGGGYSAASVTRSGAPPNRMLEARTAAAPSYRDSIDVRIKAAVAIAPWGMQVGFWDADGLAGIRTPLLVVAGSVDDVAGYEKGPRAIWEGAVNAERYLLTFLNANHNAAAPIPAPAETWGTNGDRPAAFAHYADAVWDTVRMNNILAHFATAFFDHYVKGEAAARDYLALVPHGKDGVWAMDREGRPQPAHTYWKGFRRGTAVGLSFEKRDPDRR
ncbi:MAG: dienelactone hydrolase family protein [Acidobacteriota bacterium]